MSIERRSCTGSAPHVTKRLCAIIMFLIGIVCILAGFLFGRMAQREVRRSNEIIPINLTVAADNLYKQAKRVSPKAVHHNDPEKITARLLEVFHCSATDCGTITIHNVADFVKRTIKYEVNKLIKSIHNATTYLDSLR